MTLSVRPKMQHETSQATFSTPAVQLERSRGYSEQSTISSKDQNASSSSCCSSLINGLKKCLSSLWYYISFQWLWGKSKKNESTEETPSSSAVSNKVEQKDVSEEKEQARSSKEPVIKSTQQPVLNFEEIKAKQKSEVIQRTVKMIAPFLESELPPSLDGQKAIRSYLMSFEYLSDKFHAFETISKAMLKKSEDNFQAAISLLSSGRKFLTSETIRAAKNELDVIDLRAVEALRTMRYLMLLSLDVLKPAEDKLSFFNVEKMKVGVGGQLLYPYHFVFEDASQTLNNIYDSLLNLMAGEDAYHKQKLRQDGQGPLFNPFNQTTTSYSFKMLREKVQLLSLGSINIPLFMEGSFNGKVLHNWEDFDKFLERSDYDCRNRPNYLREQQAV